MSFWPFSNSLNNSSHLQKFLETLQDFSSVNVDDLISEPTLLQELINELQNILGNYDNNIAPLQYQQQQQQQQHQEQQQQQSGSSAISDTNSISSSNENNFINSKDSLDRKLVELLIQPHILNGFLDYIVRSVDFFHDLSVKEHEGIVRLLESLSDDNDVDQSDQVSDEEEMNAIDELKASEGMKDEIQRKSDEETETEEDKLRRCIQASSDILSADLWIILNRIIETPIIMDKLWLILSLPNLKESSPSTAYIVHILDQLMDSNSIELLNYIRQKSDLVDVFIKKIEVPMLMDFLLRVIQTDKPDYPTGIIEVLWQQKLIPRLVEILKPDISQFRIDSWAISNDELFFRQTAATDFIKALITISSNSALAVVLETNIGPNQLSRELISPDLIHTMIKDIMLFKVEVGDDEYLTNKHGLNNCVSIIIELIRKNNSDYDLNYGPYASLLPNDNEQVPGEVNPLVMFQWLKDFEQNPPGSRDPLYLGELLSIFSDYMDDFGGLMNIKQIPLRHTENDHSLGFTSFKVSELIAELLHCSNMILLNSKKIGKIISIRDVLRNQKLQRLEKALSENLLQKDVGDRKEPVHDVTNGLDDISLDDIHFSDSGLVKKSLIDIPYDSQQILKEGNSNINLEIQDNEDDCEENEPKVSPENPFVCPERDKSIRENPCVGDKFKIKLYDLKILEDVIFKFTSFPWHNFFHNVVFDLIQQIFNGKLNSYNSFLIVELFNMNSRSLTDIIMKYYDENASPRPGYMGHIILISEEVVKFTSLYKPDLISPLILSAVQSEAWEKFVNGTLYKTRETYNVVLGAEDLYDDDDKNSNRLKSDDNNKSSEYLDLDEYNNDNGPKKNVILLGESSNHDLFVNDKSALQESDNIEDNPKEADVPDVRLDDISPVRNENDAAEHDYENDQEDFQGDDFLDNLSGSDSSDSDEENSDEEAIDDENAIDDANELRRVPNHRDDTSGKLK